VGTINLVDGKGEDVCVGAWCHALVQSRMPSVSRSVINPTWLLQQSTKCILHEVIQVLLLTIPFLSGLFGFINNHADLFVGYKKNEILLWVGSIINTDSKLTTHSTNIVVYHWL
jgi:hypothetical protein